MARPSFVPPELTHGPFMLNYARSLGLTRQHLRSSAWRSLGASVYAWRGIPDTPLLRLRAVQLRLPFDAVLSGVTAGWIYELLPWPRSLIEVTVSENCGVSTRVGVLVRRGMLRPGERVQVGELRVTSPLRTIADLAVRLDLTEAVVATDTALRSRLVTRAELDAHVAALRGAKGVRALRRVVEAADGLSESPMESRLRMLLVNAGLGRPECQAELTDGDGRDLARVDLYYPAARLAIEYDGAWHRESLVDDNRRQNRILAAGYQLLRFTAADLRSPAMVVAQVRVALQSDGRRRAA